MADINRDDDLIELAGPPRFAFGERVVSRSVIRNDGTYPGRDVGEVLAKKGEIGYVTSIGTYLQQFYIYAVEFVDSGARVGMRAKELCSLDDLPEEILAALGADKVERLERLGRGSDPAQPASGPGDAATSCTGGDRVSA